MNKFSHNAILNIIEAVHESILSYRGRPIIQSPILELTSRFIYNINHN